MREFLDFILHAENHLRDFITTYGAWVYALLFGIVFCELLAAAVLGDAVNYAIGAWIGPKVFERPPGRFFNRDHLMRAHAFYERYGGRAIILARFVPIGRTFAPFVAGIGRMRCRSFAFFNVAGAILWIGLFVGGGYLFGNLPVVRTNMKIVILGIIVVSVLPMVWELFRARGERPRGEA